MRIFRPSSLCRRALVNDATFAAKGGTHFAGLPLAIIILLVIGPMQASAQAPDAAERCEPDVMRLCSEFVPDRDNIVTCLKAKRRQLSQSCLTALQSTKRDTSNKIQK